MNLVADIGGTNVRFAIVEAGSSVLKEVLVLPCSDFSSLHEAIKHYAQKINLKNISEICLALPGPVDFQANRIA